ncbi:uncharacterized protein LOC117639731 [Thrips palmi]|uniref:Uncharacterized protein LOC117639731 n=1 Tax=Thrips palmi TaxID=161013 RepID=A0A6P8XWS1_THRPL|nr:uncharacterized protein LOC117639731 [Thrips palmi]
METDSSSASVACNSSLATEASASSVDVTCNTSQENVSAASLPSLEHSYAKTPMDCTVIEDPVAPIPSAVPIEVLLEVRGRLLAILPKYCVPIVTDQSQVSVVLISRQAQLSVQRSLQFHVNGDVTLNVHCKTIPSEAYTVKNNQFLTVYVKNVQPPIPLEDLDGVGYFADRALAIVNAVRLMEVCAGVDNDDYSPAWESSSHIGVIDGNPYKESTCVTL